MAMLPGKQRTNNLPYFADNHRICPQSNPAWNALAAQALGALTLGLPPPNVTYVPPGANASSPLPKPDPRESEDCLFLDVFAPKQIFEQAGKGPGAPVLVWIYGGGYTGGSKNYNPAGLLAASGNKTQGDIIYVAMNYRLGALGWLSGPTFQAEGGVSNLGLYDQRMALEWIQKNIHLFGGDKNRVGRLCKNTANTTNISRSPSSEKVPVEAPSCIRLPHTEAPTDPRHSSKPCHKAPAGSPSVRPSYRKIHTTRSST